jgi:hypothetical protein
MPFIVAYDVLEPVCDHVSDRKFQRLFAPCASKIARTFRVSHAVDSIVGGNTG